MNKKQRSFQFGRAFYNFSPIMWLAFGIEFEYEAIKSFMDSQILAGIFLEGAALYSGFRAARVILPKGLIYLESKEIRDNQSQYPLEHSERIIIEDEEGLESLLSRTNNGEEKEWGTFLKAYDDNGTAVVSNILDASVAKELGLIKRETEGSIRIDSRRADKEGYNGFHHYHPNQHQSPNSRAANYFIHLTDRFKPKGWINLLTFNLPEGPEIIGFNRQHTYIPVDATKRELVRATPKQIMEYLAK